MRFLFGALLATVSFAMSAQAQSNLVYACEYNLTTNRFGTTELTPRADDSLGQIQEPDRIVLVLRLQHHVPAHVSQAVHRQDMPRQRVALKHRQPFRH